MSDAVVVGRYAFFESFARGGMASVHYGRRVDGDAIVAVKRLHPHLRDESALAACILDEARIATRISHPNVVQVLDVLATHEEMILVMEYVDGLPLSRLLRGEVRVPPAIASRLLCDVLSGLEAAHAARAADGEPLDVVHRDVSPQNILVTRDGRAKLTDFGIAKAIGRSRSTTHGVLKGKLAYMSPEQAAGEKADPRTDLYAAAIVLWEMLLGRRLFVGTNEAALLGLVLRGVPSETIDEADAVAPGVAALLRRALARHPRQRFPTAAALRDALKAAIPPASPEVVARWAEQQGERDLEARGGAIARVLAWSDDRGGVPVETASVRPTDDDAPTLLVAASPMTEREPRASRGLAAGWLVAALATAVVGSIALVAKLGATSATSANTVVSSEPAPRTPAAIDSAPPPPPIASTPTPHAIGAAPAEQAPVAKSAAPRPPHSPPPPRSAPRRHEAKLCDPPYTVDSAGLTHFRAECLR